MSNDRQNNVFTVFLLPFLLLALLLLIMVVTVVSVFDIRISSVDKTTELHPGVVVDVYSESLRFDDNAGLVEVKSLEIEDHQSFLFFVDSEDFPALRDTVTFSYSLLDPAHPGVTGQAGHLYVDDEEVGELHAVHWVPLEHR